MQYNFLNAFQHLKNRQAPATGVWLMHGDEDLLSQWLIEKMSPNWRQHNMAISRMDITSAKSWQAVLAELNSLSLFDDHKAIIVHGNHKPDKEALAELAQFATSNSSNCLVIISDKYDKKSQNSAFFLLCDKFGHIIECHLYQEQQREQLLQQHAQDFGLELTKPAWQMLMAQTQHNLLAAYQSLWRLSYLYATTDANPPTRFVTIDESQLFDGLVSQSMFTTFDLSDAMLAGDTAQVAKILQQLKASEEPESLVLWMIAKDMRNILSLQSGASYQSLGIWQSKQQLYSKALHRHSHDATRNWSDALYQADQAIKGLVQQPAWELLYQLAFRLAGQPLFH